MLETADSRAVAIDAGEEAFAFKKKARFEDEVREPLLVAALSCFSCLSAPKHPPTHIHTLPSPPPP